MVFSSNLQALQSLLPASVVVVDSESVPLVRLDPREEPYIAKAVARRREEFVLGRSCARHALSLLGIESQPILAAEDRRPIWPPGIVGSITHTQGYCAAAVARDTLVRAVGIDVEQLGRLSDGTWDYICTEAELRWIGAQPEDRRHAFATTFFSVKEAFYKCQYPLTRRFLGFHDVHVELAADTFRVQLSAEQSLQGWQSPIIGRWIIREGYVFSALVRD